MFVLLSFLFHFCFVDYFFLLVDYFLTKIMFLKCLRCQRNLYLKRKSKCRRRKLPQLKVYELVISCDQKGLLDFNYLFACVKHQDSKRIVAFKNSGPLCLCSIV